MVANTKPPPNQLHPANITVSLALNDQEVRVAWSGLSFLTGWHFKRMQKGEELHPPRPTGPPTSNFDNEASRGQGPTSFSRFFFNDTLMFVYFSVVGSWRQPSIFEISRCLTSWFKNSWGVYDPYMCVTIFVSQKVCLPHFSNALRG